MPSEVTAPFRATDSKMVSVRDIANIDTSFSRVLPLPEGMAYVEPPPKREPPPLTRYEPPTAPCIWLSPKSSSAADQFWHAVCVDHSCKLERTSDALMARLDAAIVAMAVERAATEDRAAAAAAAETPGLEERRRRLARAEDALSHLAPALAEARRRHRMWAVLMLGAADQDAHGGADVTRRQVNVTQESNSLASFMEGIIGRVVAMEESLGVPKAPLVRGINCEAEEDLPPPETTSLWAPVARHVREGRHGGLPRLECQMCHEQIELSTQCLDLDEDDWHQGIRLGCDHVFGAPCLVKWQKERRAKGQRGYCPLCRAEIRFDAADAPYWSYTNNILLAELLP